MTFYIKKYLSSGTFVGNVTIFPGNLHFSQPCDNTQSLNFLSFSWRSHCQWTWGGNECWVTLPSTLFLRPISCDDIISIDRFTVLLLCSVKHMSLCLVSVYMLSLLYQYKSNVHTKIIQERMSFFKYITFNTTWFLRADTYSPGIHILCSIIKSNQKFWIETRGFGTGQFLCSSQFFPVIMICLRTPAIRQEV